MKRLLISLPIFALALAACGGGAPATPEPKGDAGAGATKYATACVSCHGPDAKGMTGLGKDLTTSEFVKGKTDDEMLAFLKTGRSSSDPLNTTGVDMPPKGGNPALTDDDLYDIVAFIRSLQK
jgi:disulfide bond formation protein DsbB